MSAMRSFRQGWAEFDVPEIMVVRHNLLVGKFVRLTSFSSG